MSDLIERSARATYERYMGPLIGDLEPPWHRLPEDHRARMIDATRAGLDVAVAALRVPSEAALESAETEFLFATWEEVRDGLGLLLDAFMREHGLEMPRAASPKAQEGRAA